MKTEGLLSPCAVIAIIGTVCEFPILELLISLNRLKPSLSGICTSVRIKSKFLFLSAFPTSFTFLQVSQDTPLRSSISLITSSWTESSSTTSTWRGSSKFPVIKLFSTFSFSCVSTSGSSTRNTLPFPMELLTEILPPNNPTSPFVIESPNPNPSEFTF